jgi:hypothetical protein
MDTRGGLFPKSILEKVLYRELFWKGRKCDPPTLPKPHRIPTLSVMCEQRIRSEHCESKYSGADDQQIENVEDLVDDLRDAVQVGHESRLKPFRGGTRPDPRKPLYLKGLVR